MEKRYLSEVALKAAPRIGQALLAALRFDNRSPHLLAKLTPAEWQKLLAITDRSQATLLLGHLGGEAIPAFARERIGRNYRDNQLRFGKLKSELKAICGSLNGAGIEFAVLKGFSHAPHFTADPVLRSQGDIDIWCQPSEVYRARDVLSTLGYRSIGRSSGRHLDPLIREFSWKWTGNYYAPDLPIPVDLHYQLWDSTMEHIPGPVESEVWCRRVPFNIDHLPIAFQLRLPDTLAFAALHVLTHLLHGEIRLQRAWELGYFLQANRNNEEFWDEWRSCFPPEARQGQTIPLALSHSWFGCDLPNAVRDEVQNLPRDVRTWLKHYSMSSLCSLFTPKLPHKDELWLNLAMLNSRRARMRIFLRRALPIGAVARQSAQETEYSKGGLRPVAAFLLRRAAYHLRSLPLILVGGLRWWWRTRPAAS